jgi:exodeoxyribonuclease V beta subunit
LQVPHGDSHRFVVVDYKTNRLGDPEQPATSAEYGPDQLSAAMLHSDYPLQAMLYSVVLHRYLRWRLPSYDPEVHLGGVIYLYLRGMCGPETPIVDGHPAGVFSWPLPAALVLALSDLLDGRTA